jgi:hypothetical protein
MADRFLVWLSAGALAVGVSAGTLAGAAVFAWEVEPPSDFLQGGK